MPKTLEQQFAEIFGENNTFAARSPVHDEALARDLKSLDDMPEDVLNAVTDQVGKYVEAYKLTHSQLAAVLLGVMASEAGHCPVANVVTVQSLEVTLRALLEGTAIKADAPLRPLLEASVSRILADDAIVVSVN